MYDFLPITTDQASLLAGFQTQAFIDAYSDLHSLEDIHAYCDVAYTPENALADISDPNTLCLGAFDRDGSLSGYYIVNHHNMPDGDDRFASELKRIYIAKSVYGTGLGSILYDHAVRAIREYGSKGLWLCVSNRNYRAQKFYQKRGFVFAGIGPELYVGKDVLTSSFLTLEF
jgi:ribosomal protein S18 acetylase RimI-like enzyme